MALPATVPATWDAILSTTMHNYRKTLTDNIFNSRPLLEYLSSKGRVRTVNGGISIVEPVLYGVGDAKAVGQWEQIAVIPQDDITAAQFGWKQLVATIAISALEEAQNNGKEMIVNLLEAKIMQAEESLKQLLSGMLFAAAPGPKDFDSLNILVDSTGTAGGIDQATNTWWASYEKAVGAVAPDVYENELRVAYNKSSDGGSDHVDALFGAEDAFEWYEATLTPQVRYTDTSKANLGFQNLMFKGVPFFWDFACPAGTVYGLNSKYVGLVIHSDRNFKQSPFSENLSGSVSTAPAAPGPAISGLDARVSFISTFGNLTIRNRRRCFKLTGIAVA